MSQPPLSRLISSLEDELATQLFERTTRSVKLTGAGVYLLKEARELVSRSESVQKELRLISKRRSGTVTLAFSATAFLVSLPKILDAFRDRFPKVKVELQQESRRGIIDGLKDARFDACFLDGQAEVEGAERHLVQDEAVGVLMPRKHPLAKSKSIELRDLRNECLILHPRREQRVLFDMLKRLCRESGFRPKTYVKGDNESCPVLVAIGKGVSLTIAASPASGTRDTAFVPIRQFYLPVSVLWIPGNSNPSLKTFLSVVMENKSFKSRGGECLMDVMRS
jgi:DNA-binding transcriptional LysR family regulator